MNRRHFLTQAAGALAATAVLANARAAGAPAVPIIKVVKADAEWRKQLTPEQYSVLRQEGTERPYTSALNNEKRKGTFACAGCDLPLFESRTKFESGTGWPSFYAAIEGAVGTRVDKKFFMVRTEYHCARCEGHQGHIFDDGPKPTGLRYCNNGVALKFVPA